LFPDLVSNPVIAKVHSRQQTSGWEQPDIWVHPFGIWICLSPSTSLDLLVECLLACLLSGPTLSTSFVISLFPAMINLSTELLQ
jgi:hypothetical protein